MEKSNSHVVDIRPETEDNRVEIGVAELSSPVLARLIDEVRNEEVQEITAYNRMHNRHNRSR